MSNPDYQYFLHLQTFQHTSANRQYRRWIIQKGTLVAKDGDSITITTPLDPTPRVIRPAIGALTHSEAVLLYDTLNSEIVKTEEPDTFNDCPTWQNTYNRTHKNLTK